jgi:K+-transporting ATPase c subunit
LFFSYLVNNRPRVIDDRLKQLQPQQNKSSKSSVTKSANDDLKKLIQERRKAAANTANQNHDIEIFVAPK